MKELAQIISSFIVMYGSSVERKIKHNNILSNEAFLNVIPIRCDPRR